MKHKIVVSWPGFTGYMGACLRALAQVADVRIFIEPSRFEQRFDGSDLSGLDWTRVEDDTAIEKAIEQIRNFAPELVLICGWSTPLSRALAKARIGSGKRILAFDMPWEWSVRKILARFLLYSRLHNFDAAFVPGECAARYARWLGFKDCVMRGSNPSGWERFSKASPSSRGFVFVGRLIRAKGLDVLLKAYALYRSQSSSPWTLDLIGSGDATDFDLGEGVRLRGFLRPEDMPQALSEFACLVLPSRWEPWGVSAAEAMSAGLMTILSSACGIVADVSPTIMVRPNSADELAAAMLKVERMSADELAAESARVRPLMARYSATAWAARVLTILAGPMREDKVCVDPWEEHCVECGEPDCYRTCAKFVRSAAGRCARFINGIVYRDGVREVMFRPWGKLELNWHGRLASRALSRFTEKANRLFEPIALSLGSPVYRVFRSLRWRIGRLMARSKISPNVWRIACSSKAKSVLFASVARADGAEILRRELKLSPGVETAVSIPLPLIEAGSLFRVSAYEGTEAPVVFRQLEIAASSSGRMDGKVKCVVWDLDGTLWDGTLSEGDEVRLRPEAVAQVKALDDRGIVNSIASKNDADLALKKLKEFGIEEYFVFPQINWGPKSASLKKLAEEMNIGLDAIVFIDDREENRAEVRANCPGVRVVATLDESILSAAVESGLGSARRAAYRTEMARRAVQARDFAGDAAAFLKASELKVELLPVEGERVARCRELVQRTNQLTITARRYSEAEFAALIAANESRAVQVWDKYGDYGIVGFVAWNAERIIELVFSCRVARKGVELKVLKRLPPNLAIDVIATERNAPIREIVKDWLQGRIADDEA